jgi:hypothetical protein
MTANSSIISDVLLVHMEGIRNQWENSINFIDIVGVEYENRKRYAP